jgi:GGDEF domain-containing protein
MPLDLPTLFLVSTCVTALLGIFLLVLWLQDRSVRALGYWASAYLIGGFAVALWIVSPDALPAAGTDLASALLFTCCGLIWCGARKFHGRGASISGAVAGAVVWLIATRTPELMQWDNARVVVSSLIITSYAVLTAIELRRDRRKPKGGAAARARALTIPVLHGVIFLSPILTTTLFSSAAPVAANGFFPLFALLTLLYVVGTAFIVVVMAKEYSALVHKTAAMTDHLTGLFNRRGFLEAADKLLASQRKTGQPVTIVMFDLDHFKSINDRFGHDVGDEALQAFAATASTNMRLHDIVGRRRYRTDGGRARASGVRDTRRRDCRSCHECDGEHRHCGSARRCRAHPDHAGPRRSRALCRQGEWSQSRLYRQGCARRRIANAAACSRSR